MSLPRPPAPLPLPPRAFKFDGAVTRIVDGDTIDVTLDLGFGIAKQERLRLKGINAPEVTGDQRGRGLAAKALLSTLLPLGEAIRVETYKPPANSRDKYGRYVAYIVRLSDALVINHAMLDAGAASPTDDDGHALVNERAKALRLVQEEATR